MLLAVLEVVRKAGRIRRIHWPIVLPDNRSKKVHRSCVTDSNAYLLLHERYPERNSSINWKQMDRDACLATDSVEHSSVKSGV